MNTVKGTISQKADTDKWLDGLYPHSDNHSGWHDRITAFMRQKIPLQNPSITLDVMKSKSDEDILDRVEVIFKNIAAECRKLVKPDSDQSEDEPTMLIPLDDSAHKSENRHKGRKILKCDERKSALVKQNLHLPEKVAFFLQPPYQSTDECDYSDVLDPESDTEKSAEIPAKFTRKPWKSRTPRYRGDEAHASLDSVVIKIDRVVMDLREQYEHNNKGKTSVHPRISGDWKDVRLPYMPGAKAAKIPRELIDPEWLEHFPDDNTPSRIAADESPAQADDGDHPVDSD
ncbi:hypothetical protein B0H14DRAFT_3493153 [Mycena olivaceomarginata]|nr:hypothetical protein B0H14DRAFT_3493153 [Mycena olivaceomarginata]